MWKVEARSDSAGSYSSRWVGSGGKKIPAFGHFLVTGTGYVAPPASDDSLITGITDSSSLRLVHGAATIDAVCYAFDATKSAVLQMAGYTCEGTPVSNAPHDDNAAGNVDKSIERKPGGAAGNCTDTGDSSADFVSATPATPQNTMSPATP